MKEQGYAVTAVYDVNAAGAQALATELGCEACTELRQVTKLSDVIITVVTDDAAMKKIFSGGLLEPREGQIVHQLRHRLARRACEGGGKSRRSRARNRWKPAWPPASRRRGEGTLYLMCGGKPEAFERAKPILEKLSASLRYIGTAGTAAQVKALVNMVMNINTAGLAEGLGLGAALGLDLTMLREVFSQTGANSRVLQPTAKTCRTAIIAASSPRPMPRRIPASRLKLGKDARLEPAARHRDQKAIRQDGGRRSGRTGQIRHRRTDLQRPPPAEVIRTMRSGRSMIESNQSAAVQFFSLAPIGGEGKG